MVDLQRSRRDHLSISFGSINTGLPKDIVQQLVNAEKIPLQKMEERKAKQESKMGLVKELSTLLEGVRGELFKNNTSRNLRELKFNTNNEMIGVTIDKNLANKGNYQLEVLQLAQKSSAMSNGVEDKDKTYLGVGYIEYKLPSGESKSIYVDADNSSLTGIAGLINKDPSCGMTATVVNDGSGSDTPWKLIISLQDTGAKNQAEFPYLYFVDGEVDLYLSGERKSQNAKVKLDGFEIEVPNNKLENVIPGVTIDLKKAKAGEEFGLEISEDVTAITGKIDTVMENLNKVLAFIKQQNTMNEQTDTSKTLGGDITLQQLESRIRTAVFMQVNTTKGPKRLGDLGVTFQKDGALNFDKAVFENALNNDFEMVSQVLTGTYSLETGKIKGSIDYLTEMTDLALQNPNGLMPNRKRGIQSNIDQIDRQIANKERHIAQKEEMLKRKFARLEETMSKIRSSGAGLAGMGGAVNPIQQLG